MKIHYEWKCPFCDLILNTRRQLQEHKKEKHLDEKNNWLFPPGGTCSFCGKKCKRNCNLTVHERHCLKNPDRIPGKSHLQTDDIKCKISNSMKKAHEMGIASSWIGRRKRSYAEQSWYNIFVNFNIEFENNYYVKPYWLDFAWPDKKIYFEVDGQTHFTSEGYEHDNIRTLFLESIGWKLIGRCNWAEYQKLSYLDKQKYINLILNYIKTSDITVGSSTTVSSII